MAARVADGLTEILNVYLCFPTIISQPLAAYQRIATGWRLTIVRSCFAGALRDLKDDCEVNEAQHAHGSIDHWLPVEEMQSKQYLLVFLRISYRTRQDSSWHSQRIIAKIRWSFIVKASSSNKCEWNGWKGKTRTTCEVFDFYNAYGRT